MMSSLTYNEQEEGAATADVGSGGGSKKVFLPLEMSQQNYYNVNNGGSGGGQPMMMSTTTTLAPRPPISEDFQKQIQQDWANREYIEVISGSIKRIADFLNSFDLSCRYRLAQLNEKLTSLERKIEVLEAWISKGETLP